jgi:RecA-family ATPase
MNKNKYKPKFYYTAKELFNRKIMDVPMFWKPFIPQKGLVGITGSSDAGKSTLLRQLAIETCLKRNSFLGFPLNSRYGSVVYISTEDTDDAISASLQRQARGMDLEKINGLKFVFNEGDPKKILAEILKEEKVDLVIIDAWTDLYIGDPNNTVQVRKSLNALSKIAQRYDCAILILHDTVKHSEKHEPNKSKVNGSQGIEAKLRSVIEIRDSSGDEKLLSILKGNYIPAEMKKNSIILKFDEECLRFSSTGKEVNIRAVGGVFRPKFKDDKEVIDRMKHLKKEMKLSISKIEVALIKEFGDERTPSCTRIKEILSSFGRSEQ